VETSVVHAQGICLSVSVCLSVCLSVSYCWYIIYIYIVGIIYIYIYIYINKHIHKIYIYIYITIGTTTNQRRPKRQQVSQRVSTLMKKNPYEKQNSYGNILLNNKVHMSCAQRKKANGKKMMNNKGIGAVLRGCKCT
jgi:hypothetical protein